MIHFSVCKGSGDDWGEKKKNTWELWFTSSNHLRHSIQCTPYLLLEYWTSFKAYLQNTSHMTIFHFIGKS